MKKNPLLKVIYQNETGLLNRVQVLLDASADPNEKTEHFETPLRVSSNNGRFDVVKLLFEYGANPEHLNWTELFHAVAFGSLDDVKKLMNDIFGTRWFRFNLRFFLFAIFPFVVFISPLKAENLKFSTYNLPPFVGKSLAKQGALTEIISEAFKASGYSIDLKFYPAKRAIFNAKKG